MQGLSELKKKLTEHRPAAWDQLPDFPLYMDQVVSYMPRQVVALEDGEKLTSAMINNYIKDGLLPRAQGKRYTREHIAYLTAICTLKQVMAVKELGAILPPVSSEADTETYYSDLLEVLNREMCDMGDMIDIDKVSDEQLSEMALELAVSAYCRQYLCKKIIGRISSDTKSK